MNPRRCNRLKISPFADDLSKYYELANDYVHQKKKKKKHKKRKIYNNLITDASKNLISSNKTKFLDISDYMEKLTSPNVEPTTPTAAQLDSQQQKIEEPESLYDYANALKKRVNLVCINDKIFYHNGYCYIPIDKKSIIKLYRQKVDYTLHYASSMSRIKSLYDLLITDPDIEAEDPGNLKLCTLRNGIYDPINDTLHSHTPEIITFSYINANLINKPNCPYFEKFLSETFDDNEILIERVWQMLGYIMIHTDEGKCFFVMGEAPNSGKSLLGNFICQLFPREHVSNVALNNFNARFSLIRLVGAAVNVSLDLPSSKLKPTDVSNLKMITGGDYINVEEKCQPCFSFKNRAKFVFASNFPIYLSEDDEAFWNRLIYIPFNKSIPPELQDKDLLNKFIKEKDSIVTKALYHVRTLVKNKFVFPSTIEIEQKITQFRRIPIPTVDKFIEEKCEISSEFKGESVQKLYDSYNDFCYDKGFTPDSYNLFSVKFRTIAGVEHAKMRFGGSNPLSAFRSVKLTP